MKREQAEMTQDEVLIATAVASWKQWMKRMDGTVAKLTEEQFETQIAPNRNRVRYVVGHLTAVNDRMLKDLGIGERLHPELDEAYITNPDKTFPDPVSVEELKKAWTEVGTKLTAAFEAFTPAEWAARHMLVSEEGFAKEPLRNRLAMVLGRTAHVAMHLGQLVLVK